MSCPDSLQLPALRAWFQGGGRLADLLDALRRRIAERGDDAVWIVRRPDADLDAAACDLDARRAAGETLPLFGVPFAVKDNIDIAGVPTTAACPDFAYVPERSAAVVEALERAGALWIGKTNLDQFATGLVGTRSPFGAPRCVFDPDRISGGSSSGSAVAVAAGLVSFALGTDTAGSGRVPAAFNNLVGLKPSRGRISARGVVPACQSLDCVSLFALSCDDARTVFSMVDAFDLEDPYARRLPSRPLRRGAPWRVGVPRPEHRILSDPGYHDAFERAIARVRLAGAELVDVDFQLFRTAAALLYEGPWVAERRTAVGAFFQRAPESIDPVVRRILTGADRFLAEHQFEAEHQLAALRRRCEWIWDTVDVLMVPTAPRHPTFADVEADPLASNAELGLFTNFVNLLDLAGVAVPSELQPDGLPFGVTFLGPAGTDLGLLDCAEQFHRASALTVAGRSDPLRWDAPAEPEPPVPTGLPLAVVGAHMTGLPLNRELTERGARFLRRCRTAPEYRLFALPGTTPPKPGLVRDPGASGAGALEVEVWDLPWAEVGSFLAGIPRPLGLGTLQLEDGTLVKGFLCERHAISGARDITALGGWRAYLATV